MACADCITPSYALALGSETLRSDDKVGQVTCLAAIRLDEVVPHAQVHSHSGVKLPVILNVRGTIIAVVLRIPTRGHLDVPHIVGQHIGRTCSGIAYATVIGARAIIFAGVYAVEVVPVTRVRGLGKGSADALKLHTELERLVVVNLGDVVQNLVDILPLGRRSIVACTGCREASNV